MIAKPMGEKTTWSLRCVRRHTSSSVAGEEHIYQTLA